MPTLRMLQHPLASPGEQLARLDRLALRPFDEVLEAHGVPALTADAVDVLQVNVGKRCNQT
jgi:hypothetical protein